jgi:UDP-arabinose 4-epimerase
VAKGGEHVLVTGGAGYIGSHAALRLIEDGHAVTIVDNLSRGNCGAIRALQAVAAPGQLRFVLLDLGDTVRLTALFQQSHFDVVVHFAAIAYVAESYDNPLLYYKNVTANTMHVLEAMRSTGVTRIVYSSTCATYGNPNKMPITENTPQKPVSPYGSSKLVAEQMIKETAASSSDGSFSAVILRYFNVIGSDPLGRIGEHPVADISAKHGRISGACFNAALGKLDSLSITGTDHKTADGTCVRDYIHVVDLIDAHVRAIGAMRKGTVRVYNVGVGKGYSVREFVDACIAVTGVNITVVERQARPGDAAEVYSDPRKIKRELLWVPKFTNLRDTLATSWKWTSRHPNGYDGDSGSDVGVQQGAGVAADAQVEEEE